MSGIRLIVGLGNPGPDYQGSRHNAGADFVRELAARAGGQFSAEKKFPAETCRITFGGKDLRLLIPTTYMNHSGQAVSGASRFYGIEPQQTLVCHDELDLPPGTARWKNGGGHGGHNGLRDIVAHWQGEKDFLRLRLGIGHPGKGRDVAAFVLKRAPASERTLIEDSIQQALQALPLLLDGDWERATTLLHTEPSP